MTQSSHSPIANRAIFPSSVPGTDEPLVSSCDLVVQCRLFPRTHRMPTYQSRQRLPLQRGDQTLSALQAKKNDKASSSMYGRTKDAVVRADFPLFVAYPNATMNAN